MAKLTARFDIKDNITKKLKTIRGEIEAVENARRRTEKPTVLNVVDKATEKIDKVNKATRKIVKPREMVVNAIDRASKKINEVDKTTRKITRPRELVLNAIDRATKKVNQVDKATRKIVRPRDLVLNAIDRASKKIDKVHKATEKVTKPKEVVINVVDKATKPIDKINKELDKKIPKKQETIITAKDKAMPILQKLTRFTKTNFEKAKRVTIEARDKAMPVIRRVASYATTAIPRVRTFTIRAINAASNVIGSVKRALFSIPTVIAVTLTLVGLHSLGDATVGAAMNFEQYEVSMRHWLDGNIQKAKDLVGWMGQFADSTPFSTPDLFPALASGVGISGGNVPEAQRMLKIATDMAALTPGRSVTDAMDALGSSQMGNFESMKGFGLRVLKEDYDAMGGWAGFLDKVESNFLDGAKKLSETSSGILATLKGYRGSIMRSMGEGFLDPMKPRLDAINQWLANNQETWGRWKNTVKNMGEEASEWLFSKLENGFTHIKNNYLENEDFTKLDFEGKIKFISEDIGAWWSSKGKPALNGWWESSGKPWAEKIGLFVGESIFNGILLGITEGGKALGGMWSDAFKDPSLGAFGGAGVATVLAGMLASMVLSPLITAVSLLGKGVKGAGNLGKKFFGKGGNGGKPIIPGMPKGAYQDSKGRWHEPNGKFMSNKKLKEYQANQTQGPKKVDPVPRTKGKGFKMPKGLSKGLTGLGKFAKRVPVIGTVLGALSILTASKEDKAGAVGGVGGGVAGAATGAAIGSAIFPVIGTAIGGIIGGIVGSLGGQAIGDWLSKNWSSIKKGASDTADWIVKRFNKSVDWVKDTWSNVTGWFSNTIWKPLSEGFNDALDIIVGLYDVAESAIKLVWGAFSSWFDETIWTPLKTAAGFAWDFITTKVSDAWTGIQMVWGLAWSWFDETVWTPISTAAGLAWDLVSGYITGAWDSVVLIWGLATGWFEETIWIPISTAVEVLGSWIGEKFTDGWNVVTGVWGVASSYFEDNVWSPIKSAVLVVKDTIVGAFEDAWEVVSGIYEKIENLKGNVKDVTVSATAKAAGWVGKTVNNLKNRGADRRGNAPAYARGTNFHPGGPAIVGDGGGPELIRYPNGNMSLSPGTDTMMNLPRGTEVLSHKKTIDFFNAAPAYAEGIGFNGGIPEKVILSEEKVSAATSSSSGGKRSLSKAARDIIVQITGDHHYSDEEDFDTFKGKVVEAVNQALDEADFEGGAVIVDV